MSQLNEGKKAFAAGTGTGSAGAFPLDAYTRVALDGSGGIKPADHDDDEIGITDDIARASGDHVTVRLRNFPGTRKVKTLSDVTEGAALYPGANGAVDTQAFSGVGTAGGTIGTTKKFTALEDADEDGLVEVLPV